MERNPVEDCSAEVVDDDCELYWYFCKHFLCLKRNFSRSRLRGLTVS